MKQLLMYISLLVFFCASCRDAKYYYKKANLHEEKNKFEEAIIFLNKAIEIDPRFIDAYIDRGVDKSLIGDYEGAIVDYSTVIEIDSLNMLAYSNRANNYKRIGELHKAYSDIQQAYKIATRFRVGDVYVTVKRNKNKAQNSLFSIDENKYEVPLEDIILERGVIYYSLDSLNAALADMEYCLRYSEQKDQAYYWRGLINIHLGKTNDGCEDLTNALSLGMLEAQEKLDKYCNKN